MKSRGREAILYDTLILATCQDKGVQTHKVYSPQSEPWCTPWASGGDDVSVQVHGWEQRCHAGGDVGIGGCMGTGIRSLYEEISAHSSQYCYQPKTALEAVF